MGVLPLPEGKTEKCYKIVCWFGQGLQPPANPSGQVLGIKHIPIGLRKGGCPRHLLGALRSLVGMNDLGRNYET